MNRKPPGENKIATDDHKKPLVFNGHPWCSFDIMHLAVSDREKCSRISFRVDDPRKSSWTPHRVRAGRYFTHANSDKVRSTTEAFRA
jgi:hypothetical protein